MRRPVWEGADRDGDRPAGLVLLSLDFQPSESAAVKHANFKS